MLLPQQPCPERQCDFWQRTIFDIALKGDFRHLGAHIAGINRHQAQVVVLKDALDWSFEEIAAASGMPVGTAKCYAHRGRARLRERFGDREVA